MLFVIYCILISSVPRCEFYFYTSAVIAVSKKSVFYVFSLNGYTLISAYVCKHRYTHTYVHHVCKHACTSVCRSIQVNRDNNGGHLVCFSVTRAWARMLCMNSSTRTRSNSWSWEPDVPPSVRPLRRRHICGTSSR